ncbi:MAG: hypothetical protein M2R45_03640 [Verrucomicrobia subdivision 3 bacterium]|nr:hypothetical protein [Limisphaerales bacterium]MCS1416864.1 hypothetical protein [Limisphaerales bacterium]
MGAQSFYLATRPNRTDIEKVECKCPLVDRANTTPHRCLYGFIQDINEKPGVHIIPTEF